MMILKPARLMFALLAIATAPAFAQNVATVNGKAIPASKVDQVVKQVVAQGKGTDGPQLRDAIKKDLIGREVLIQEADKQGMGNRADVKAQLDNARQSIIINAMLGDYMKKNPVKDAEVKAEYDKYKASVGDKEYHVRHILVKTEDEAKAIIVKLKAGAKFEDFAKANPDATAANGGDLDWTNPGAMVPEFSKAMVTLKKGEISQTPVQTRFGYHIIKLEDTRPFTMPPLDQIKQQFVEQMQQRKLAVFREDLMKKAKIQ